MFTPSDTRLWELLCLHNTNRLDYNNRVWETMKLFQGSYAGMLGFEITALVAAVRWNAIERGSVLTAILLVPVLMIAVIELGRRNLHRELKCLSREEYQVFKIARLVGLDQDIDEGSRLFIADKHLLLEAWRNPAQRLGVEEWKDSLEAAADKHATTHRLYGWYKWICWTEGGIATLLFLTVLRESGLMRVLCVERPGG